MENEAQHQVMHSICTIQDEINAHLEKITAFQDLILQEEDLLHNCFIRERQLVSKLSE